eukprot:scaffold3447_cov115-Skeletonema_marinoi.AAC.2
MAAAMAAFKRILMLIVADEMTKDKEDKQTDKQLIPRCVSVRSVSGGGINVKRRQQKWNPSFGEVRAVVFFELRVHRAKRAESRRGARSRESGMTFTGKQ